MTLHYGVEHAVPEILFIILGGIQLILMQVPDASAKRDPQFDTIDLALPFIAAAFYAWGCGSMMIWRPLSSSPLWLFYAHVQGLESTTAPTPQTIIGVSVLGWRYFY